METQGPPNLYDTNSKAYQTWQQVGQILNASKPRGLVVVSAHWEADDGDEGVESMSHTLIIRVEVTELIMT